MKAFSRVFFAGLRIRLGRSGRCRGSARVVPHALARDLDVGIYDGYLRNMRAFPALSAAFDATRPFVVIPSGASSLISSPP